MMTAFALRFIATAVLLSKSAYRVEEDGQRVFVAPSSEEISEAVRVVDELFAQPSWAALATRQIDSTVN